MVVPPQVSLILTLALCGTSVIIHGLLPALFTLLVSFNGLAFSKGIFWACVELQVPSSAQITSPS